MVWNSPLTLFLCLTQLTSPEKSDFMDNLCFAQS